MTDEPLFNPDDYPSPDDGKGPKRRKRKAKPLPTAETLDPRWHAMANRQGVLDRVHVVKTWNEYNAALTLCGVTARSLGALTFDQVAYPCVECKQIIKEMDENQ